MNGTEWTEPGHGATVNQIHAALAWGANDGTIRNPITEANRLRDSLNSRGLRQLHRTNLRLTGAPLTAEDLKRIAEAK